MAQSRRHLITRLAPFRALALLVHIVVFGAGAVVHAGDIKSAGPVFTVLASGAAALPDNLHYLASSDKGTPLSVSVARRSEPLPAAAGATLVFGVPRPHPATGESKFVPLCSVVWPAGASERVLVLLAYDGNRLAGIALDDGGAVFPPGTLRVINLMSRPIAARWGNVMWEIRPGPGVARPYPVQTAGRFKVMLGALRPDGGGGSLIYVGRAEARPGARTLVVIREVHERAVNDDGEVVDAGISYNTRWVVDSLPNPEAAAGSRGP